MLKKKKTEPWGKSGSEQNEGTWAYQYVFKTKKPKPLPIETVPGRKKKIQRVSQALYIISAKGLN